jgi:hypothetical protein
MNVLDACCRVVELAVVVAERVRVRLERDDALRIDALPRSP